MATVSKVQDWDEVVAWLDAGKTYRWISKEYHRKYGVETTEAMWAAIRRRSGLPTRIVRDASLLPWQVQPHHRHAHAAAMLRAEARQRAGKQLTEKAARDLRAWRDRLASGGLVVHYDRSTGWHYVNRRPGIDVDLIRVLPRLSEPDERGFRSIFTQVNEDGTTSPWDPISTSLR